MIFPCVFPYHTILDEANDIFQSNNVQKAEIGGTVTLDCFFPVNFQSEHVSWYKQTLGQKLHLIVKMWRGTVAWSPPFTEDSENGRVTTQMSEGAFNLTIRNIKSSDEAAYHCAVSMNNYMTFGNGTFLALTGKMNFRIPTVVG